MKRHHEIQLAPKSDLGARHEIREKLHNRPRALGDNPLAGLCSPFGRDLGSIRLGAVLAFHVAIRIPEQAPILTRKHRRIRPAVNYSDDGERVSIEASHVQGKPRPREVAWLCLSIGNCEGRHLAARLQKKRLG
jgi:hypothetical protein